MDFFLKKGGRNRRKNEIQGWNLGVKHLSLLKPFVKDWFGLNMIWKCWLAPQGKGLSVLRHHSEKER